MSPPENSVESDNWGIHYPGSIKLLSFLNCSFTSENLMWEKPSNFVVSFSESSGESKMHLNTQCGESIQVDSISLKF